jgi:hypothetical protein
MYAKLIDGQLVHPPQVSHRPDGSTVIGYDQRPDMLTADGWKPVVDTECPGEYYAASWQEYEKSITQVWTAYEPPAPPPPPPDPLEHYYGVLQSFAALWASLNVGPVPSEWTDALALLDGKPMDAQIKLLAYRIALAPVWDSVLERMAGNA